LLLDLDQYLDMIVLVRLLIVSVFGFTD